MVRENYHGGSDIFPEISPPESDKGFPAGENCDKIKRKLRNFRERVTEQWWCRCARWGCRASADMR